MNALSSLHTGRSEDSDNVNALLLSTQEIEKRIPEVNRWLKLWKRDVREGWAVLSRFKVRSHLYCFDSQHVCRWEGITHGCSRL
jgi:hypothetical protein